MTTKWHEYPKETPEKAGMYEVICHWIQHGELDTNDNLGESEWKYGCWWCEKRLIVEWKEKETK